jgi:tRNA nucleotidyltransferase (CCA-adding enzyme)
MTSGQRSAALGDASWLTSGPAARLLAMLNGNGEEARVVGGAVRNALLGLRVGEIDVATTATPEEVMRRAAAARAKSVPTGIEHGTVTVLADGVPVEVTTFRGEGAYLDGRRPSSVTFLSDVDADLARRDFTVNALAYDPLGKELRDPFGGRDDLGRRVLRAVGDASARFAEDGLRPLRAARFAAQLGFEVEPATRRAIRPALPVTAKVSAERVMAELSKLVLAPGAQRGLELLDATGLLAIVLPELAACPAAARRHAYAAAAVAPRELPLRLAALLHVLPRASGPGAARATWSRQLLQRMRFPGDVAELAAALVAEHACRFGAGRSSPPVRAAEVRRFMARVGRDRLPQLFAVWEADARAGRPPDRSRKELAALRALRTRVVRAERDHPPLTPAELALDGRAVMDVLGAPPGPEIGTALRHLLDRVLDDPRLNTAAALTSELRAWRAQRPGGAAPPGTR